jgi:hypothetical protein
MFNKQVLSRITSALNSAKAPAKKKDIIVDPRGQWDHPGQPTRIPANEITMRGVPYPVMAYPDNGQPQLMYPDQEYSFPGAKYVDEYPQMNRMRNGGTLPQAQKGINISDYNEYVYRKAAYDDSLYLYNQNNSKLPSISVFKYSPSLTHPNGINRPAIKVKQNPRKIIKSKDDQMRGLYFAKYFPTETPIYKNYYNKTGKKLPTNLPVWLDSQTAYQYPHFKYTNKYPNGYGYIKPGEKLKEQIEYAGRWKKPVQPVYFGKTDPILNSNNTNPFLTRPEAEIKPKEEPVEEIGRLPLKPLTEIPTKYSTEGYIPNASYLNTKKNTIKPPASTTQWVQHPQTGTWHQIERPVHPALLPTYDLRTGSYKQREGGTLPKAQIGKNVQSTAISAQDYMDAYNHAIALENYMKNRLDYHSIEPGKNSYYGGDIPSSEMIYNDLNSTFNRWIDPKRQYPRHIIRNNIMTEEVLQKDIPILDYYQQIDENKFRQRELLDGTIDMDVPMGYYDKRIPISQLKEYHSNDPDMHNGITIPMYDQHYLKDEMIKSDPNIQYDESGKAFIPQKKQVTAAPNKGLILPESTLKWVQNPQTGTWHQIQRPQDTNLTPVYDINTGSYKKQKQGGSLLTKKVTCKKCGWKWDAADGGDDITTCHKCGGQGLVHAKQGGTNKVVNAYSKHFQPGGEQETRLPKRIVNRYPGMQNVYGSEGENLNVIKDPNYAASDYGFGDIEFIHPGSGHVQYSDDYDYQSPTPDKYTAVYNPKGANKHDVFLDTMHGMRDDPEYMKLLDKFSAETKKARGTSMDHWYGVDSEKNPYLVGDGREQWDKNFIDGVLRSHLAKKGMGRHSSDVKGYKMEREESTPEMYKATDDIYKYLKGKFKKGGFQDDLGKNRKVFEDWTYGKDLGMTYLPKAQNGITISDPKEYAYRNKMYTDSLNLYNAYKMQDKLMGPYSGTSKSKYKWNTAELKKGRKKEMVPGIPYPIANDYQNEKDQFKDGFDPWTARPQDLKLIKYYKSLGFTDKDIMYHSSPDVVSDKIRAVGTYDDGTAASPIYRKPKQKVTFGPNNVLPVEEKLELKTKPLQFIDTNRDIQDIVPNADYLKQYLQTRTANAIVPPASTLKWVQHPQTGTWYQIERPKNTMLTPEYNIRTGSYKKQ